MYEIYTISRDQADSTLTSLKSIRQKDLDCNFDDVQWDSIYKSFFWGGVIL